jgi:wyosine [tRNA(Phe)-imidazoG37] synthetase (radical SAM superfamily)
MQAKLQEYMAAIVAKIKEYPKIAISISALSFLLYAIRKQQYRIIYLPGINATMQKLKECLSCLPKTQSHIKTLPSSTSPITPTFK